jgi:hypothetical protein
MTLAPQENHVCDDATSSEGVVSPAGWQKAPCALERQTCAGQSAEHSNFESVRAKTSGCRWSGDKSHRLRSGQLVNGLQQGIGAVSLGTNPFTFERQSSGLLPKNLKRLNAISGTEYGVAGSR